MKKNINTSINVTACEIIDAGSKVMANMVIEHPMLALIDDVLAEAIAKTAQRLVDLKLKMEDK